MKVLFAASVLAASALVFGCATPQYTAEDLDGRVVCDQAHMTAIERQAQRKFAEVHWVHCPTATVRVVRN